jgi:PAS domain S-box-containing protein
MPLKGQTAGKDDLDAAAAWQVGTYEWWPKEDRLTWSCGLVRIYGLERTPAAEAGFIELVHPEDRIRVEAETSDYLGSGALSYSHSFRIVRPDGAVRLILDRGSIERDAVGAVRVIRGLNVDVTDLAHADLRPITLEEGGAAEVFSRLGEADQGARSQAWHSPLSPEIVSRQVEASRAAADSDARLQEILEAADTGTWDWRVGAERPNWSPPTFELFGLDPAQGAPSFAQWLDECVHPEDRARARRDLEAARALGPGQEFALECRTVHPERGVRWMATSGRMTRDGADGAARLIGLIADITERKATEEGLRERNRQLDLLGRTSQRLLSDAGPESALLEAIFSDIAGLLGVESFLYYRPVEPRMLRLELAAGLTEEERQRFATTRFGELLCGRVAETKARLIVEDLQQCPHPGAAVLRRAGATSYAGFPLLAAGKLLGTVCFLSHTLTHFRDGEVEVIQSICDQIAIALERRRLQRELEESEARQRLVMDNTVAFAGLVETDGTLVEANAPALAAGGLGRDDVVGRKFWDCYWWSHDPVECARLEEAVAGAAAGAVVRYDAVVRMAGDTRMTIDFMLSPLRNAQGDVVALVSSGLDITERKQAEAELRESRELLQTVLSSTPDLVWAKDRDGRITLGNKATFDCLGGGDPKRVLGHGANDLVADPAQAQAIRENDERVLRHGEPVFVEESFTQDGEERHFQTLQAPLRDAAGAIVGIVGVSRDITEKKRAEQALAEATALLESLFENAPVGLGVWDRDFRFARINRELAALNGLPPEAHIGRRPDEILPDLAGLDVVYERWRQVLDTGEPWRGVEVSGVTPAQPDRTRYWSEDFFPVRVGDRNVAIAAIVQETTERKAAEEALRTARDSFRHLVERSPFGIYAVDADFRLVLVSNGAQKVFENVRPLIGRDFAEVLRAIWPEPFASEAIGHFRHTLATGVPFRAPGSVEQRADSGETETYDWRLERVTLPDGRPGVVCHFYDLSERQRHEEHIQLLMRELNHRSKNMLGLIQAIAQHTASTTPRDFVKHFGERVRSLAAAQDLLVSNEWRSVPLLDLVRSQLFHFADLIETRTTITGPPLSLTPAATQALGMALHELATNAVKYGAFSTAAGRVAVTWTVQPDEAQEPRFTLAWTEEGGPPVVEPQRRGFGHTVTTRMVETSVGGEVRVDYAPRGFDWRLACPLRNIIEGRSLGASRDT